MRRFATAAALTSINLALMALGAGVVLADPVELELAAHKFTPSEVTVPANQKFQIKVTNHDETPAEFESHDLKVEKIVVPGGSVTVNAGPLKAGTYKFFDDYHPDDAVGAVTAKE
jgi:heme/copper-type cytochrome/quinol oxidase subunit 2